MGRQRSERHVEGRSGKGLTLQQVADHNSRVTLEAIRRDGPLTRKELASRNGLTPPGVTNIVRKLSDDGLIVSRKRTLPSGAAGSIEFVLHKEGAFSIGIRLGKNHGEAILLNLGGIVRERYPLDLDADVEQAVSAVVRKLVASLPSGSRFLGVGIAVDPAISFSLHIIQELLEDTRVLAEDECTAAVLSERVLGVSASEGDSMYVLIGERVRAGLLLRDKPFSGVHGRAGQIGRLRSGADQTTLDDAAGLPGLRAAIGDAEYARIAAGGELVPLLQLDAWAQTATRHLLDAIVATAGFLAPGVVVLGGDLPPRITTLLVERILKSSADYAQRPFSSPWMPQIRAATFEQSGMAVGAALLPFFDTLLPSPFHADPTSVP